MGNSTNLVSGFVKEGSYVDVLMTVERSNNGANSVSDAMTLQLFDGVKVYAVNGNESSSVSAGQNEVTLELTPQQQKVMVLAKEKGRISLTYNPDGPGNGGLSIQASKSDRVLLSEILGIDEPEEDEKPFLTEQYRNGTHRNAYYDKDGRSVDRGNGNPGGGGGRGTPQNGSGDIDVDSTSVDQPATGQRNQQASLASGIGF
ncbi:MAG: hypothetical protein GY878_08585 [Fuerstiella sp.]|nr:hypothetical protein [Fuerstiella sp.]